MRYFNKTAAPDIYSTHTFEVTKPKQNFKGAWLMIA
jgi:hypothetical protein